MVAASDGSPNPSVAPLRRSAREGSVGTVGYHRSVERAIAALSTPVGVVVTPFRVLLVHHSTIGAFVRRDIRGRYVTSALGLAWALIQPLVLLLLYTFVFAHVLGIRFGADGTTGS